MDLKLPPVLSGEDSKNSFHISPSRAENLKWIRATSLNVLRDCPMQFYDKFCRGLPQPTSKGPDYAMIGTIFHEVIESYIVHKWDINSDFAIEIQQAMMKKKIRKSEIINLGNYLYRIKDLRHQTIKVEHEFEYELIPNYPKIRGHIDWILVLGDNHICVWDHKTNRQPKTLEKWMDDLQTIAYSWAVRKYLKLGFDTQLSFNIGYVNLPYDANWIAKPSFDQTLQTWYRRSWSDLLNQERLNRFQRTPSDTCKYCPETGSCVAERKDKEHQKQMMKESIRRITK